MMLLVSLPVAWFNDDLSEMACNRLNVRIIPASSWVSTDALYDLMLPLSLSEYIRTDKLHAIYFKPIDENLHTIRLHPDALLKIGKKEVAKRIKRISSS